MSRKSIGIVGYGFVGKSVERTFGEHFDLSFYDPRLGRFGEDAVKKADLLAICVPTPEAKDGSVDLQYVNEALKQFSNELVMLKSTVSPGTTTRLSQEYNRRIVFVPEYAGESSYVIPWWKGYPHPTDPRMHSFHIFGGEPADTHEVLQYHKTVIGPSARYFQTDACTAELAKYMCNVWGAMKVTFANEFFEIAKAFGVDYDVMRELVIATGFMEAMHSMVFEEKRGFGGKCLPKDLAGIIAASIKAGYQPLLLQRVHDCNEIFLDMNNGRRNQA